MSTSPLTFIGRSHSLCGLTLTLLIGLLAGCGGAIANEPGVHRAGPDLRGYYGTRTPAQLAYGGPTGVAPGYTRERPDLDAYLKPSARAQTRPSSERATIARALPKAATPRAAAATQPQAREPQPLLAVATPAPTPPLAAQPSADAQRYAAREARSSQQQQYRGGDVVVISATTIIIILLVVLLILLLT